MVAASQMRQDVYERLQPVGLELDDPSSPAPEHVNEVRRKIVAFIVVQERQINLAVRIPLKATTLLPGIRVGAAPGETIARKTQEIVALSVIIAKATQIQ